MSVIGIEIAIEFGIERANGFRPTKLWCGRIKVL